jgi:hypothetical protein
MRMQYASVGIIPGHGTNNITVGASFYFGF